MGLFIWLVAATWLSLPKPISCSPSEIDGCRLLWNTLRSRVSFSGSSQYNSSISSYFYKQTRLLPTCIVRPYSTDEVSITVKTLVGSRSLFAIRGGGHGSVIGSANVNGGVTMDMRSMSIIQFDEKREMVSVGAGATWDRVYQVLDPYNVSVLGGRAGSVGLGGFITGGGISFFSPERGFACDYVANFEVVLANGKVVNANETNNKDLFIALKGGGNNFGIVTRFDLKTFAQEPFLGGAIVYPESTFEKQVVTFTNFKNPQDFDSFASVELSFVYLGNLRTFLASASLVYSQPTRNASVLAPFTAIQPQLSDTMRVSNMTSFTKEVQSLSTPDQMSVWATTTFQMSPNILTRVLSIWKDSALSMNGITNVTSSLTFQSVPRAPRASQPNSLGFNPSSAPEKHLVLCLISIFFEDPVVYNLLEQATRSFIMAVNETAGEEGLEEGFTYLNYAGKWQGVMRSYGNKQHEMLRKTAKKYDPSGVFRSQVGGFKLF